MIIAANTTSLCDDLDLSPLEELGECRYFGELSREELFAVCRDADALLINKITVDEELLSACPRLKYVGTFATGYDLIDLQACRKRGITVCNAPDYSTHAVAQHTFALLLSLYGRISEYTASVAKGDWIKSKAFCYFPYPTRELYGKTFGVLGYGNIGKAVAKIAEAFGANVIISTRTPPKDCPYKSTDLDGLLKESDIISLHCPLTPATARVIDEKAIGKMKKSAVIINTARGGLLDEKAVAEALNSGRIAGACLDTVDGEPMLATNPLYGAKNCLITPHVAWVAHETRARLIGIVADNLKSFLNGNPKNVVS